MTLEELKNELDKLSFKSINFGHNVLNLAKSKDFENWQSGSRVSTSGESLISGKESGWQEQWYVIAKDSLEDPHFVDLSSGRVYTAIKEEGDWFPVPVADDLQHYMEILNTLKELSSGRETPDKLKNNSSLIIHHSSLTFTHPASIPSNGILHLPPHLIE